MTPTRRLLAFFAPSLLAAQVDIEIQNGRIVKRTPRIPRPRNGECPRRCCGARLPSRHRGCTGSEWPTAMKSVSVWQNALIWLLPRSAPASSSQWHRSQRHEIRNSHDVARAPSSLVLQPHPRLGRQVLAARLLLPRSEARAYTPAALYPLRRLRPPRCSGVLYRDAQGATGMTTSEVLTHCEEHEAPACAPLSQLHSEARRAVRLLQKAGAA